MAKVIKLKQSDIEKIVEGIVKEQEWKGSSDPDVMQLGQQGPEEVSGGDQDSDAVELSLGQDENGNFYVMKNNGENEPQIVMKTK